MDNKWIFIIDTDEYAGNFEREMCAYITGITGDCEVGDDFAKIYHKETGDEESRFSELLEQRPDEDNGCCRPCSIWATPGWFNHGMGGNFKEGDEDNALKDYIKIITKDCTEEMDNLKMIRSKLESGEKYSNWTISACNRELKQSEAELKKEISINKVHKYPACLSVAIFFEKKPSDEIIDFMKKRAKNFVKAKRKNGGSWDKNFKLNITGFRLVKESTKSHEQEIL